MYYICLRSCIEINNPEKVYFYYVHEPFGPYWELIKPSLSLVKVSPNIFVEKFKYPKIGRKKLNYAHQADFIRLEKLIEKGGVYADMDTLFVNKLPAELFTKPFVLGREPDIVVENTGEKERSLCNAFIMAEPGSMFARRWLDQMESYFDGSWSNHSTVLPQKLSEQFPGEIHIEPQTSFYHFLWTMDGLRDLFERDADVPREVYSIHLWKHLWFSHWKNDFSSFNGLMLNETYIRSAETTYARLARPYLPSKEELSRADNLTARLRMQKKMKKTMADTRYLFTRIAAKIQYHLNL